MRATAAEQARWNMRVTLSLRNHYERVENGHAIAVPAPKEPDTDDLLDRFLVIGTPDTCIRQIKRIQELVGITHFNCSFWFGDHGAAARAALDGALRAGGHARLRLTPRSADLSGYRPGSRRAAPPAPPA